MIVQGSAPGAGTTRTSRPTFVWRILGVDYELVWRDSFRPFRPLRR